MWVDLDSELSFLDYGHRSKHNSHTHHNHTPPHTLRFRDVRTEGEAPEPRQNAESGLE